MGMFFDQRLRGELDEKVPRITAPKSIISIYRQRNPGQFDLGSQDIEASFGKYFKGIRAG